MAFPVRLARNAVRKRELVLQSLNISAFLCPALLCSCGFPRLNPLQSHESSLLNPQVRCLHLEKPAPESPLVPELPLLPLQCTGCGAYAQTDDQDNPGFFDVNRKTVKEYLLGKGFSGNDRRRAEEEIIRKALENAPSALAESLSISLSPTSSGNSIKTADMQLLCDRCHRLEHHHTGVPIHHPSIDSLQDIFFDSPYKYNHIYHVLDAADFPMSLVPRIHDLLDITPQRSRNRRAKSGKFYHGKKTEMSFIITRSDLLAPLKTQVDSLMPYLREVLRDALGRHAKDVRLGNVRCISAKRDWWTRELKEDIWQRGGGGWMVGKVNVGKSQLFAKVFPKGRSSAPELMGNDPNLVPDKSLGGDIALPPSKSYSPTFQKIETRQDPDDLDSDSLLPPALPEVNYPSMPLVSFLPGTTASPIRIPYGNGKGELIDLPGLSRGNLELHVQPEHRTSLVMRSRVVPEQQSIRPGQSLLLGNFIRITPTTPNLVFLGYAFTPIPDHLTATEKAIAIQEQREDAPKTHIIALPETAEKIASAGKFKLKWDVTKQRSGPITRSDAVGFKLDTLPWRVLSTDILIEGCGWVELVAQVRTKDLYAQKPIRDENLPVEHESEEAGPELNYPEVEIFSPEGKFVAARRPMNGWLLGRPKPKPANFRKTRPRPSKKGEKRNMKAAARNLANGS